VFPVDFSFNGKDTIIDASFMAGEKKIKEVIRENKFSIITAFKLT